MQLLSFGRRFDEAEPYIREIWQLNPKDIRVYQSIGVVYSTAGKYNKAVEAYRKSLEIEPNNPGAYLGLAGYYAKNGQIEEAIKAYDKVLELKADVPNIMIIYANLLRNNGRRREALEMYKRSLAMLPTNSAALLSAGILSAKLGDLDSARQYLGALKAVDAKSARVLARFLNLKY
jgi:Tfp pilus assembly protein PilF